VCHHHEASKFHADQKQANGQSPRDLLINFGIKHGMQQITGSNYKCRKSYISINIVTRYRLQEDQEFPGSVRLVWRESSVTNGGRKTKSTRFWYIEDKKIDCDVAIGRDFAEPDPLPEETNETDGEEGTTSEEEHCDESDIGDSACDLSSIRADSGDDYALTEGGSDSDGETGVTPIGFNSRAMTDDVCQAIAELIVRVGPLVAAKRTQSLPAFEGNRLIAPRPEPSSSRINVEMQKSGSQKKPAVNEDSDSTSNRRKKKAETSPKPNSTKDTVSSKS
jgi:hypothetical protein